MSRNYKAIKHRKQEIQELQSQGYSQREIGGKLGYSKEQIKEFLRRERRLEQKKREQAAKPKGRPRKHPAKTLSELEKENKRLRMENDLLRDFLKRTEGK